MALFTTPGAAQTIAGFDPPATIIRVPSTLPRSRGDITCYVYDDAIIRISGADSPSPDNALILPPPKQGAAANCGRRRPSGMEIASAGLRFDGRLGAFLLFEVADPSGASYFTVFNLRTGHALFQDGLFGLDGDAGLYGITNVNLNRGVLHMRYMRGVNTACSLLSDRDGCWSQLLANGDVPRGAFSGPPSLESCNKSYASGRIGLMPPIPGGDRSIVSYEVALTLDSNGNAKARPLGAPHCDPMP